MKTIGDLIKELKKYPASAPVVTPRVRAYASAVPDEDGNDATAMEEPSLCLETVGMICKNGNRRNRRAVMIGYKPSPQKAFAPVPRTKGTRIN